MNVLRSMLMAVSLTSISVPLAAEVHHLSEKEYQKFIDEMIGAIEKGTIGVGGSGGSGSPGQPSSPSEPSGGNEDGDSGNDGDGDGIGESW